MAEGTENDILNEEMKKAIILETEERVKAQYEEKLNVIRKEEKDKLYPEITKLKTELELAKSLSVTLQKDFNAATETLATITTRKEAEIEKLKADLLIKKQGDTEMDKESLKVLEDSIAALTAKLAEGDSKWLAKEAEWKKEKSTQEISSYRKEKLSSLDESMHDLVRGETKEEVDASFVVAQATFDKLSSRFGSQMNRLIRVPADVFNNGSETLKNITPEGVLNSSDADFAKLKASLGLAKK